MANHSICADIFSNSESSKWLLWFSIFRLVFIVILQCITIVGNLLVIIVVCTMHKVNKRFDTNVLNMAIVDFCFGVLITPLMVIQNCQDMWLFSENMCEIWVYCGVMLFTVSTYSLCLLSINTYIAVGHPIYFRRHESSLCALIAVLIVWSISILSTLPLQFRVKYNDWKNNICKLNLDYDVGIYLLTLHLIVPLILLVVINTITAISFIMNKLRTKKTEFNSIQMKEHVHSYTLQRNSNVKRVSIAEQYKSKSETDLENEKATRKVSLKTAPEIYKSLSILSRKQIRETNVMILMVIGSFVLCWIPFGLSIACQFMQSAFCDSYGITGLLIWTCLFTTSKNPIIYGYFNSRYRDSFKRTINKCKNVRKATTESF